MLLFGQWPQFCIALRFSADLSSQIFHCCRDHALHVSQGENLVQNMPGLWRHE